MSDIYTETEQLAAAMRAAIIALRTLVNDNETGLAALTTTEKANLVAAINELKTEIDEIVVGTGGAWGGITGDIDDQTDLKALLDSIDAALAARVVIVTPTDLAGGTELAVNGVYFDSFTTDRTLTFTGTPADGDAIKLSFDASTEIAMTIPTSYRYGDDPGTVTSVTFPAGNHIMKWERLDSRWYLADSAWETSGAADTTAPILTSLSGSQTAPNAAELTVTTDEGNGTLYWYLSTSATPPSAADLKAGTGATASSSEAITSTGVKTETFLISAGTYYPYALHRDSSGNDSDIEAGSSFVVDAAAPTLSSVSPTDGATGVSPNSNIAATFSENVFLEDFGTVTIVDISTPANNISYTIPDAHVTVSGAVVTINPEDDLDPSTAYAINISNDCVRDAANNFFAGITGNTVWNFTTAASDVTAPTLSSATIGTNGTTLTLVFSETVAVGAGGNGGFNVDASTGGSDVTCTYVSGSGTDTLVYTLGTTILSGETCDLDYTQPGNGIEDSAGNDLASIASAAVTNNSTQGLGTNPTATDLLAWWELEDASGNFVDSHTTARDMTAVATPTYQATGQNGFAATFNGSTQYAYVAATLDTAYPISFASWVKTTSTADGVFVCTGSTSAAADYLFSALKGATGKAFLRASLTAGNTEMEGTTTINDGNWHHIVAVFSSATSRQLYVDGVAEGTPDTTSRTFPATNRAGIATITRSTPAGFLNGSLDDCSIWNKALSSDEVTWLYNNTFSDL